MSGVTFRWPGANSFGIAVGQFQLGRAERVLLLGPSGSGKSTFLSLLCGIVAAQAGRVDVLGTDLGGLGSARRDRFRAEHFGVIFQMFNLLPYGSVVDNVALPLAFAAQRRARVVAAGGEVSEAGRLLRRLGLPDEVIAARSTSRLSVGQQQRVAAARAFIGRPELIVADEPTSALDRDSQGTFLDLMFEELAAAGSALVMVSHDETLAGRFDRVLRLDAFIAPLRSEAAA